MRGTRGSACPQPEPNATELPSSAPGRPELIELQATYPSPTPTRAEENIATTPGCGPAGYSGLRAFDHADTHRGTHRHNAWLWTCRPPRLRPRRHAEHLAGLQIVRLRALALRRAPPPTSALPKKTSHVAGLQTSPRFAPSPILPLSTLTSRATHAHPTSPRSTGFCAICR